MPERMVTDELKDFLLERNGQLVFVSDLPMEWLRLRKYPLYLTHDICRIPEFNFNSLINNFIHSQRLTFRIKPDILKKTLIIHCASDDEDDMHEIFEMFEALQPALGYVSVICNTVQDVADPVKKHEPHLLIFDCHVDADPKTLSNYLVIDDKNDILLTGDDSYRIASSSKG